MIRHPPRSTRTDTLCPSTTLFRSNLLFYTGRRISGDEALRIGLADVLVPQDKVRSAAQELALEIAQSAPLAILSIRQTMRRGYAEAAAAATERELTEQSWLTHTAAMKAGAKASRSEKRRVGRKRDRKWRPRRSR